MHPLVFRRLILANRSISPLAWWLFKLPDPMHQSVFFIIAHDFSFCSVPAPASDPEFTDSIENITVPAGRTVKLACSVKNLGSYKVIVVLE